MARRAHVLYDSQEEEGGQESLLQDTSASAPLEERGAHACPRCKLGALLLASALLMAGAGVAVVPKGLTRLGHAVVEAAQKWSAIWAAPEDSPALGLGFALHARGLIKSRGSLCLHAKHGYGSQAFMGDCETGVFTQQWQFDVAFGHLMHQFAGCLDAGGEKLHMWKCDPANPAQKWEYNTKSGALINHATGMCLDTSARHQHGALVRVSNCTHAASESWSVGVRFGQMQLWRGACLWVRDGTVGDTVQTKACGKHSNQGWFFDPSVGQLTHVRSNLCAEASEDKSVRLRVCSASGVPNKQQWAHNVRTGHVMSYSESCLEGREAQSSNALGGSPVRTGPCFMARRQSWSIGVLTGQIRHRHGTCLHIPRGADTSKSVPVRMGICEESREQQWSYDDLTGSIQHLSGLCLAIISGEVVARACSRRPSAVEQWTYDALKGHLIRGPMCLEAPTPMAYGTLATAVACSDGRWTAEWQLTGREQPVTILTVQTGRNDSVIAMQGVPGRSFINAGRGRPWHGFKTKLLLYQQAVRSRAVRSPGELLILMDTDVAFGGCSEWDLVNRYKRVVSQSDGAQVVVSADPYQYPPLPDGVRKFLGFRARRKAVMDAFGLPVNALEKYLATDWPGTIPIAIDYAFVNSGFMMGPAAYLLQVLECALEEGNDPECMKAPHCGRKVEGIGTQCCFDDQRGLSRCALKYPNKIAIDYTGSIMLTTHGMYNMFDIERNGVRNKATQMRQCFMHSNCANCPQPVNWGVWFAGLRSRFPGAVT